MDEICMMFAPNMWRSVHIKHAMPYVYQIFVSNMCPVPMRMVILPGLLKYIIRFQKKHTTVQVHRLHVVPFNESSKERWQMEKVAARCSN